MTDAPKRIWEFDRYINGVLMAEGVSIERQPDLASAMKAAAIIASRGPHGEVPVLILRDDTSEHAALIREAEARGRWLGLKDARDIANLNAWKHVGDDPYSRGMDEGARHQSRVIHVALSEEIMRTSSSPSAAIRAAKATP